MPVRTSTAPASGTYTFSNVSFAANGSYNLLSMNRARTTFYSSNVGANGKNSKLYQSIDGGTTWTLIRDFDSLQNFSDIVGVLELPNGEMLVAISPFSVFGSYVYKSSGFPTNPLTASWTLKCSLNRTQSRFEYSLNDNCVGSNGVVLISETGSQTEDNTTMGLTQISGGSGYTTVTITAPTSLGTGQTFGYYLSGGALTRIAVLNGGTGHTNGTFSFNITGDGAGASWTYTVTGGIIKGVQSKATRLFYSSDFGENWTQIYDLYTDPTFKYAQGVHLHSVAYDEDWDRIWICFGDNTGQGTSISSYPTNTQVTYSDDRGVTWNYLTASSLVETQSIAGQYTGMRIFKNCLLLDTDQLKQPFVSIIYPKIGYRTFGTPSIGIGGIIGIYYTAPVAYTKQNTYPLFIYGNLAGVTTDPVILYTLDGYTYNELWRETDLATRPLISGGSVGPILGPDASGRIIGTYNSNFIKGTIS